MKYPNWTEQDLQEAKDRMSAGRSLPVKSKRVVPSGASAAPSSPYQSVFVPGPLPGANDIIRKHHMVYSRLKSEWGLTIARCILVAKLKPVRTCAIRFRWQEPNHRRDDDNVMFAQKFVLDALRDSGIIPDDRRKFVTSLTHCVVVDAGNPGVLVELLEI